MSDCLFEYAQGCRKREVCHLGDEDIRSWLTNKHAYLSIYLSALLHEMDKQDRHTVLNFFEACRVGN